MEIADVKFIFEAKKNDYLRLQEPDAHPLAILLGGQGAVGKGQLNYRAEELFPEKSFLIINGDNYRTRHPDFYRVFL